MLPQHLHARKYQQHELFPDTFRSVQLEVYASLA